MAKKAPKKKVRKNKEAQVFDRNLPEFLDSTERVFRRMRRRSKRKNALKTQLKRMFAYQTPRSGNKCKSRGCKGTVVKRAFGMFRGNIQYSVPECNACGRTYLQAKNVAKVGIKEFVDSLNQPMTI